MRGFFAAIALLVVASPSIALAPLYDSEWEGERYREAREPIARFIHFPIDDDDGDGFAYVPPVPSAARPASEVVEHSDATNALVQSELERSGATRKDIIAAVTKVAILDPVLVDRLPAITAAIEAGDFVAAVSLGAQTGLEVRFFCGQPDYIRSFSWFAGIPYPADCNGDAVPDLAFNAVPLYAFPRTAGGFSDIWLDVTTEYLNSGFQGRVQAFSYLDHILTIETRPQSLLELRLQITRLYTSDVTIDATLYVPYSLFANDALSYTYGSTPFIGTTVWLDVRLAEGNFHLVLRVRTAPDGFSVTATLDPAQFSQIRANVVFGERAIPVHAMGFSSVFTIGFANRWSPVGGSFYQVDLSSPTSMPNLEIRGTYYEGNTAQLGFQFVGFPAKNSLLISPGSGPGGCGSTNVFSIDLSKTDSSVSGRYRTIAATGYVCDKALTLTGSNLHRAHVVSSKKDQWTENWWNNVLFMTGATANVQWDSFLDIDVNVPWLPDGAMRLENLDASRARWHKTVGWYYNAGAVSNSGTAWDNGVAVNAYYWNIAEHQLGQNWCVFRYSDGRCA